VELKQGLKMLHLFIVKNFENKIRKGLDQGISEKFQSYDEQDSSKIVSKKNFLRLRIKLGFTSKPRFNLISHSL